MITIDRRLVGVLPYRAIFFPSERCLRDVTTGSGRFQLTRLFWSDKYIAESSCIIRHQPSEAACVDLRLPTKALWNGISRGGRYDIRQAEKLHPRLTLARNGAQVVRDFLAIYNDFAKAKADIPPITRRVLARYEKHADFFMTYLDDAAICGHVLLRDMDSVRVRLLYSANRRLADRQTAKTCGLLNRYLHWHEVGLYREEGVEVYDLGGIRTKFPDGITRFKMSFGASVVPEHTYLCAGTPWLGRMAQLISDMLFAPQRWSGHNLDQDPED